VILYHPLCERFGIGIRSFAQREFGRLNFHHIADGHLSDEFLGRRRVRCENPGVVQKSHVAISITDLFIQNSSDI
jgi:hypothetical protein